ncbi:hypothetical protein PILCRDRAFT_8273 [Piloderma croceum F 1598]|uniref:Uncharacterized protein n=1 Tax=Piloderma croceum (strain F 1598) TaxID=765440 RepID=A0A0C3FBG5_PILCF|nr:hypothetical protein PILCRDRAFT_8273 [Piloderma croceum F 1598]
MVERDMLMRYHGGGIGHQLPCNTIEVTEKDADWEDILNDKDSEIVANDPELNQDIDKNDKTKQVSILEEEGVEEDEEIEEVRDSDEEEDYSYQSKGEVEAEEDKASTDEQSGEDDGLGAKDREDPDDLDDNGK